MPKKYDNIKPLEIPRKPPRKGGDRNRFDNLSMLEGRGIIPQQYIEIQGLLHKGINLSLAPQDIPLDQSPDLDCVRVEQGGLRQEHDLTTLGTAAALPILSLGDHRFVLADNTIFDRFFRAFRQVNTFIRIESWNDLAWIIEYDAENTVVDAVLLSFKSFFGSAYFADGSRVIEWKQSTSLTPQDDEFPTGSDLTVVDDTVDAVITPAASYLGKYSVHYSLVITGPASAGSSVEIAILDNAAVELVSISHPITASGLTSRVFTLPHEIAEAVGIIASGENLTLKLKAITAVPVVRTNTLVSGGGTPRWTVTKTPSREAQGDKYTFIFKIDDELDSLDPATVDFYADSGSGFTVRATVIYPGSSHFIEQSQEVVIPGLGVGDRLGIHVVTPDFILFASPAPKVEWGDAFDEEVVVHGFRSLTPDFDSEPGVDYFTEGTPINDLYELDKDPAVTPTHSGTATSGGVKTMTDTGAAFTSADIGRYVKFTGGLGALQLPKKITAQTATVLTVGEDWTVQPDATTVYEVYTPDLLDARYLGVFDDRLVGLQIDGDPQSIGWSRSGILNDWVGAGSGQLILRSDSDPVDPLFAYERISTGVAALFRFRSIMRSTPTGSDAQALSFRKWIENLGTESPHSVTVVPGGVIFLGHDRQVYFLNESGPQAISQDIQEELEQTIGDLSVVEGVYDPSSQNFILAVPSSSGSNTAVSWILDFGKLQAIQVSTWHRRVEVMNRLAIVESKNLVFAGADSIVREYNTSAVCGGYWISPMLNRGEREAEFDLATVTLRYEAEAATTILIEGSGDGGVTWVTGRKATVNLAATTKGIKRAVQSFEVSGYDTRFRLTFPTDQKVVIRSWKADLVRRGDSRSE